MTSLHKSDKTVEFAEEVCDEHFDLNFTNTFSSSVQDLAASAASKELNVDKVECDVRQGDKVGASSIEELTRKKDKLKLQLIKLDCNSQCSYLNTTDFISLMLGCNKSFS